MSKQVKLDPFNYGAWDVVTTLVQLAVAVAGIILALKGDTSALLGLGALAGGARGNLVADILRISRENKPKGPGPLVLIAFLLVALLPACGTTVSRQFVVESQAAVVTASSEYLAGCQMVTIAPAFSVDWNQNVIFGGGVFAGCGAEGKLAEFRCVGTQDDALKKTRIVCTPLSLWIRQEGTP